MRYAVFLALAACTESSPDIQGGNIAAQIEQEFDSDPLVRVSQTGSLLRAFNQQEIRLCDNARTTLARTDIKNLGYGLVVAHLRENGQLATVMHDYGVDFVPTQAEAMLVAEARAGAETLLATPAAEMDHAFLELQQHLYSIADTVLAQLEAETTSGAMEEYLTAFHAMTNDHLQRAEEILRDLD